jgi:hypothetical protein
MTSLNLNYFLNVLSPISSHRGLRLQHMNLEETCLVQNITCQNKIKTRKKKLMSREREITSDLKHYSF